jgi:hypothetical protein
VADVRISLYAMTGTSCAFKMHGGWRIDPVFLSVAF